jgi:YVTN family beta-propeller protein
MAAVTSAAAQYAYVANYRSDTVSVINTATHAVVDTINVGSFPQAIAVSPDGAFTYVANVNSSNVSVIDTATRTVVGTAISVESNPVSIAFTPAPAPSPAAVPTLSEWATILLALMLAGSAMVVIQTRRTA